MYKLNGHSVQRGVWFEPETQPMTLVERNSVSTITLGPDAPEIGFNDWLLDDEWPESPIIWRVKSIDDQTDTETITVNLEHVIRMLEDPKLFEDVETSAISGGDYCTARQAIEYLLGQQSDWVLGDCEYDVSLPYEFNGGDSLLDAIESVSETLEDAEWWYDLSQHPFVLNIRRRSNAVMSEMRGGRNVSTLRRSISRSGLYTRIWPVGKNDLHISGAYISKNENLYGRVDKVETNQGKTSEDSLRAWAEGLLNHHCEPLVTITISGLEMSQETGESLDWIQLNRVCRCPLPEFNTTILERVIKIQWRDRKKDPESVTVTLGNNAADVRDLTKAIEETSKSSGRGARGQAKQNYLFEANGEHLLYEIFDECGHLHGILRMTSESLRVAFENLNECTRSEFYLTSESLRVQFENALASTRSEFQMTSESLRISFENGLASVRSELEMTAASLRIEFENDIASARSEFQMTSESLRISFENGLASVRSEFKLTAESLRTSFENDLASTRSEFLLTSESLRISFENGLASARSEFRLTAESLRTSFENDLASTRSEFLLTSESLRTSFENGLASARSEFVMTAESLRTSFEDDLEDMSSQIEQNASQIALKVSKGDVMTQLAVEAGNVTVQGGNLVVEGMITAENIQASIADLSVLNVKAISASGNITSSNGVVMAPYIYLGTTGNARSMANAITALRLQQNGDQYTLQKQDFDDATWVDVGTFSRAAASSKVAGTWSNGVYTVASDPNGQDLPLAVTIDNVSASGTVTYSNGFLYVPLQILATPTGGSQANTGYSQSLMVTAAPAMQAVDVTGSWSNGTYTAVSSANNAKSAATTISSVLATNTPTATESGLISVPIKVMAKLGSSTTETETGYAQNSFLISPNAVLEELTATANATYLPGDGKIGFSAVTVNVPTTTAITSATWRWVNHAAQVTLQPQNQTFTSNAIDQIAPHGQVSWDNDKKGFTVTLDADDSSGTTVYSEPLHFATTQSYNAGFDDVSAPSFDSWYATHSGADLPNNVIWFKTDDRKNNTTRRVSRGLRLEASGWLSGSNKVYLKDTSASPNIIVGQLTVTAPAISVTDGWSNGTYTVTNGSDTLASTTLSDTTIPNGSTSRVNASGNADSSGMYLKQNYYICYNSGSSTLTTGRTASAIVDGTDLYNAGFNAVGSPTMGAWNTTPVSGFYNDDVASNETNISVADKTTGAHRTLNFRISTMTGAFDSNTHKARIRIRAWWTGAGSAYLTIAERYLDASSVYTQGATDAGSGGIKPAFAIAKFDSNTSTLTTTSITATAGTQSTTTSVELRESTYNGSTPCVNLIWTDTGEIVGRIRVTSGGSGGSTGITGLTVDTANHQIKTSTSSTTQSVTITCEKVSVAYVKSQNHYAYVFQAKAGTSVVATASGTVDATAAFQAGMEAAGGSKLAATWTETESSATVLIAPSDTGTSSVSFGVGAWLGLTYDENTHEYTANAHAVISENGATAVKRGPLMTQSSGTDAYQDGREDAWAIASTSSIPTTTTGNPFWVSVPSTTIGRMNAYQYKIGLAQDGINASAQTASGRVFLSLVNGDEGTPVVTEDVSSILTSIYRSGYNDGGGGGSSDTYTRVDMPIHSRQQLSSGKWAYKLVYENSRAYTVGTTLTFYKKN